MTEIALPLRGGCMCGACRYELRKPPLMLYICHCMDCQRQSGSAFGMSMPAPRDGFVLLQGEPTSFTRTMPSGRRGVVRFCGVCASRLFAETSQEVVTVRPGTLDDTRWLKPVAQNWTDSAQPWARHADLPSYAGNPPSYAEVARSWRALGIRFISLPE